MTIKIEHGTYAVHLTCVGCGARESYDAYDGRFVTGRHRGALGYYTMRMPVNWLLVTGVLTYKRGGYRADAPDFALCPECARRMQWHMARYAKVDNSPRKRRLASMKKAPPSP